GGLGSNKFAGGGTRLRRAPGMRGGNLGKSFVVEYALMAAPGRILQVDASKGASRGLGVDCRSCGTDGTREVFVDCRDPTEGRACRGRISHACRRRTDCHL